ncbi:MAG: hypothetical protein M1825_001729 [Sarcosagium campestre]|nr:MAG: hypothetical protein M1825_001729 [Sarcosagium campestre]
MSNRPEQKYHAVARGHEQVISKSWGHAQPLVDGYSNSKHKAFATIPEAEEYMDRAGVKEFKYLIGNDDGKTKADPTVQGDRYYGVANGRNVGVRRAYSGPHGAEREVTGVSGSCHQRFPTQEAAERFISDHREMREYLDSTPKFEYSKATPSRGPSEGSTKGMSIEIESRNEVTRAVNPESEWTSQSWQGMRAPSDPVGGWSNGYGQDDFIGDPSWSNHDGGEGGDEEAYCIEGEDEGYGDDGGYDYYDDDDVAAYDDEGGYSPYSDY